MDNSIWPNDDDYYLIIQLCTTHICLRPQTPQYKQLRCTTG